MAKTRHGLIWASLVLSAGVAAPLALVVPIAATLGGWRHGAASIVAAGLCLVGALVALGMCYGFRDRAAGPWIALAATLPRMGIPLGAGLVIQFWGGVLAQGGLLFYLLIFYPVTLTVEVLLLTRWARPACEVPQVREQPPAPR